MTTSLARLGSITRQLRQSGIRIPSSAKKTFTTTRSSEMPHYKGSCYCRDVQYELQLDSPEQGRTSLCHCWSCKKFFGTPFGVTTKVPLSSYKLTQGQPREHVSPNGLHREFCANCGTGILEYGDAAREQWRYVMYGTMDETGQEELTPKGEFFCKERNSWVPEVQGVFHKNELKE